MATKAVKVSVGAVKATPTNVCLRMYHKKTFKKKTYKWKAQKQKKLNTYVKNKKSRKTVKITIAKTAFCVYASIEKDANVLYTKRCLFNTGAQPDFIAKSFSPASWMKEVKNDQNLNLCCATNDSITLGKINLYIRLGDVHAKTTFNVV